MSKKCDVYPVRVNFTEGYCGEVRVSQNPELQDGRFCCSLRLRQKCSITILHAHRVGRSSLSSARCCLPNGLLDVQFSKLTRYRGKQNQVGMILLLSRGRGFEGRSARKQFYGVSATTSTSKHRARLSCPATLGIVKSLEKS